MNEIATILQQLHHKIIAIAEHYGRQPGSVNLLAVSKGQPLAKLQQLIEAGHYCFGESYLQEALPKIAAFADYPLEWHFIGALQRNKTAAVAKHFHWVHSVDSLLLAERLNQQRPPELGPLNICLQVNLSAKPSKRGLLPHEVAPLAANIVSLPMLKLRGLMTLPHPSDEPLKTFQTLAQLQQKLQAQGFELDTLSMGMSDDFAAAIAAGATWIRIGSALFGERSKIKLA